MGSDSGGSNGCDLVDGLKFLFLVGLLTVNQNDQSLYTKIKEHTINISNSS